MNEAVESLVMVKARLAEVLPGPEFYLQASPILIFLLGAALVLLAGVFRTDSEQPNFTAFGIAIMSCLAALLPPFVRPVSVPFAFLGSGFLADQLSQFGMVTILLGTLVTVLVASCTNTGRNLLRYEMVCLLMLCSAGMMILVSSGEFLSFFVGLELTSIPLYVMVGFHREGLRTLEASLKYFLLGSTASALILLGMAFLYVHTGSLTWASLSKVALNGSMPFAVFGMVLFVSGLGFKLGLAPFHKWAPDVYQGSSAVLTGYMASLVKVAVVIVFLRILESGFRGPAPVLVLVFWLLSTASIVVGAFYGLIHRSIKRMLAYSSISNAGYFCLAFAALTVDRSDVLARQSLVAYTAIYAVLTLGAFSVLAWLEEDGGDDLMREELSGLGARRPFAAFALSVFLFGLAGIPPLAGFFGKLWILNAAVSANLVGLAIILVLFSCVSLFYYLSIITTMWFDKPQSLTVSGNLDISVASRMKVLVGVLVAASVVMGVVGPRWATALSYKVAVEKK